MDWIGTQEKETITRFLDECEAEFTRQAEEALKAHNAKPEDKKLKIACEGTKWTLFHTKEIKKQFRQRLAAEAEWQQVGQMLSTLAVTIPTPT